MRWVIIAVVAFAGCGRSPTVVVAPGSIDTTIDRVAEWPAVLSAGNVELSPTSLSVGRVPLKTFLGETESAEEFLVAEFVVANKSKTKRAEFRGWPDGVGMGFVNYSARDEHGNAYKAINFGYGDTRIGDDTGTTINPGEKAHAVVVFEAPIKVANEITITLKSDAVGVDGGKFKWRLKRSDWER